MADRWIRSTDDGWLKTREGTSNTGAIRSLPSHMKVKYLNTADGRDQFQILEGVHQNSKGNVSTGYFGSTNPLSRTCTVIFEKRPTPINIGGITYDKQISIQLDGRTEGPFPAVTYSSNPPPAGQTDLLLPDFPHTTPSQYGDYRTVWFPFGPSAAERYLHVGRVSAGCITCAPPKLGKDLSTANQTQKKCPERRKLDRTLMAKRPVCAVLRRSRN